MFSFCFYPSPFSFRYGLEVKFIRKWINFQQCASIVNIALNEYEPKRHASIKLSFHYPKMIDMDNLPSWPPDDDQ